ncbi:hypothetical protein [Klebsiella pneumoniae]|uniref:hypothetical protein n=1 Tax=Klebsiella pneumoniae TaxID=573 RepID=UPI001D0D83A7|nr:hypothetical protein [Klebsiella pneumoniae]
MGMAQWEFCQETPNCFLIGPDYQLPDKGGHLMTNGSRWLGCYFAKAKESCTESAASIPATRSHGYYLCRFRFSVELLRRSSTFKIYQPVQERNQNPITNCGFRAWHRIDADPSGIGTELNITSVAVAADTVIRLTCDTEPQGKVRVAYATRPQYGQGMVTDSDNLRTG